MFVLFSKRNHYKEIEHLQQESIDENLKNQLWNIVSELYFKNFRDYYSLEVNTKEYLLILKIYHHFLFLPTDTIPRVHFDCYNNIRKVFLSKLKWFEIYDFIEFCYKSDYLDTDSLNEFEDVCNSVLEGQNSAYRLISGIIMKNIDETEINSIKEVLVLKGKLSNVAKHFESSTKNLYSRNSADYRNSIKESISAVECICNIISSENTLGKALEKIEENGKVLLHKNLKQAFKELYWYTSDSGGIRHFLKDDAIPDFDDAKFMLISCTSFCTFLISKAEKTGLKLK